MYIQSCRSDVSFVISNKPINGQHGDHLRPRRCRPCTSDRATTACNKSLSHCVPHRNPKRFDGVQCKSAIAVAILRTRNRPRLSRIFLGRLQLAIQISSKHECFECSSPSYGLKRSRTRQQRANGYQIGLRSKICRTPCADPNSGPFVASLPEVADIKSKRRRIALIEHDHSVGHEFVQRFLGCVGLLRDVGRRPARGAGGRQKDPQGRRKRDSWTVWLG